MEMRWAVWSAASGGRGPRLIASGARSMLLLPVALPLLGFGSSVLRATGVLHPGLLFNARLTAAACARPRLTAGACAPRGPFNDMPRSCKGSGGVALAPAPGPGLLTKHGLRSTTSVAASVHAAPSRACARCLLASARGCASCVADSSSLCCGGSVVDARHSQGVRCPGGVVASVHATPPPWACAR